MKGGRRRRRAKKKFSSKGISWVFRVDFQALSQVKRDAAGRLSDCQSNCCLMWHCREGNRGRERRRVGPFHGHFVMRRRGIKEEISFSLLRTHQTIIYCDCQWDGSRKRQTIVRGAWVASCPLYNWCVRLQVGYVFLCLDVFSTAAAAVASASRLILDTVRQMNVPRRVLHAFRRCCKAKAKHDKCSHSNPTSLSSIPPPCPLPVPCCAEGCVLPHPLAAARTVFDTFINALVTPVELSEFHS